MKSLKLFTLFSATILLASCSALTGEEVARLAINEVSTESNTVKKETQVAFKQGDEIVICSDIDVEYEGEVTLAFRLSIARDGEVLDVIEVDPTKKDMTLKEVKTSFGNKTSWSFQGRNAIFPVSNDGTYTFEAIFLSSENESLIVKKAELVIKKI